MELVFGWTRVVKRHHHLLAGSQSVKFLCTIITSWVHDWGGKWCAMGIVPKANRLCVALATTITQSLPHLRPVPSIFTHLLIIYWVQKLLSQQNAGRLNSLMHQTVKLKKEKKKSLIVSVCLLSCAEDTKLSHLIALLALGPQRI